MRKIQGQYSHITPGQGVQTVQTPTILPLTTSLNQLHDRKGQILPKQQLKAHRRPEVSHFDNWYKKLREPRKTGRNEATQRYSSPPPEGRPRSLNLIEEKKAIKKVDQLILSELTQCYPWAIPTMNTDTALTWPS